MQTEKNYLYIIYTEKSVIKMDMNDVNLNNMSNDDILDLYNKTKEYIDQLTKEIKEVENKN